METIKMTTNEQTVLQWFLSETKAFKNKIIIMSSFPKSEGEKVPVSGQ